MPFNHIAHRKLWHWLVLNPFKRKCEWPEWQENGGTYIDAGNECFACDACGDCSRCPLVWPEGHCYERVVEGTALEGLFKRWYILNEIYRSYIPRGLIDWANENIPEMIQLARRIRDLPLSEYAEPKDDAIHSNDDDDNEEEDYLDVLDGFDEDAVYDRRVDDKLCGDEDNIIIPWFWED